MNRTRGLVLLTVASVVAVGCGPSHRSSTTSGPTVAVHPTNALLDAPVTISVSGLPAGKVVTLTAQATDDVGTVWTSTAQFTTPASGVISSSDPSVGGSYRGTNAMGLLELMAPPATATDDMIFRRASGAYQVKLTASVGNRIVASGTASRDTGTDAAPAPIALRPAVGGLYGQMHPAPGSGKHAAVLLFGGSEGGLANERQADLLAARGYPTLDLAYFGEPGLPTTLANVPLEYFAKALSFLRTQPGVDPNHVVVEGASRGGEAALLLGATYPALVNAVVASVPSSDVHMGFPDDTKAAWTLHGAAVPTGSIAVEQIHGPILLTCGGQDAVWDSCDYLTAITDRLQRTHFGYQVTALKYPQAGHAVGPIFAYNSYTSSFIDGLGGSLNANQTAVADAHAHLLSFLAAQH